LCKPVGTAFSLLPDEAGVVRNALSPLELGLDRYIGVSIRLTQRTRVARKWNTAYRAPHTSRNGAFTVRSEPDPLRVCGTYTQHSTRESTPQREAQLEAACVRITDRMNTCRVSRKCTRVNRVCGRLRHASGGTVLHTKEGGSASDRPLPST